MESWSYVNGGKMFVQEQEFSPDSFMRNRNTLMGWHVRNNLLVPGQQTNENQSIMSELGLQDSEIYKKHLLNGSTPEALSSKGIVGRIATPSLAAPTAFSGEEESTSKLSSSVVDSCCQDSLLIDLKLGRLADYRETHNSKLFSSVPSSTPAKRARPFGSNSQTYFCQVHGCNKDLSSSKDCHRRHKVCEVASI